MDNDGDTDAILAWSPGQSLRWRENLGGAQGWSEPRVLLTAAEVPYDWIEVDHVADTNQVLLIGEKYDGLGQRLTHAVLYRALDGHANRDGQLTLDDIEQWCAAL